MNDGLGAGVIDKLLLGAFHRLQDAPGMTPVPTLDVLKGCPVEPSSGLSIVDQLMVLDAEQDGVLDVPALVLAGSKRGPPFSAARMWAISPKRPPFSRTNTS
ncbi:MULTISPECIES: hypothetical protein [unclassified Streptomyces]|uniref:hypothetical protein n=1 Tax=unclassified Streptomyces TaxID=2593676 RepID=UPI003828AFAA